MAYALGFPKNITDLIYELREWPPRRPRRCHHSRPGRDNYLMDFENMILENEWDATNGFPTGPRRFEKAEWAKTVRMHCFPNNPHVDFDEYVDWVSQGGGDEWFMNEILGNLNGNC